MFLYSSYIPSMSSLPCMFTHSTVFHYKNLSLKLEKALKSRRSVQGPVSRKTRKLFGPEGKFWNQNLLNISTVPSPQTSPNYFDNWCFIVLFSKLLKHWSWMQTQQTQNSFPGPKRYRDFRETGPWCQIHLRRDLTRKQLFSTLYQPSSCRRKNIERNRS